MHTIQEMIAVLKRHPDVRGLVRYGSRGQAGQTTTGDYDLFVILAHREHPVSSLHFFAGGTPVDLNLITLEEIPRLGRADLFEKSALLDGEVLFDPTCQVEEELARLQQRGQPLANALSDHEIARMRHGHRHVFHKVRGRETSKPLFCYYLLGANMHWLVESYFRARNLAFPGEKRAIEYLETHEPEISALMTRFYAANDLEEQIEIQQMVAERVLAPIGGMWRADEILAFGDEDACNLQESGARIFQDLFGNA